MKTIQVTTVTKDSPGSGQVTIVATYSDVSFAEPAQRISVAQYPEGNPNFSRIMRVTEAGVFIQRNGASPVAFTDESLAKIAVALENSLTFAPYITEQPVADSCVASSTAATFEVSVVSELAATYQWQYSADGVNSWTNCSGTVNGCAYSNATTDTLTCTPTTVGQNGYYHRCVITNARGSTNSNPAQLTITA